MKFKNTEVMNFEGALRGMRNPMNSWDKRDSRYCRDCSADFVNECPKVEMHYNCIGKHPEQFVVGDKDLALAQRLIKAGSEHRKFMRQIFVCVDITAPLYWWKEFDTYKVGTVANSTSTMHKLASAPITLDCFDIDDYDESIIEKLNDPYLIQVAGVIGMLEELRKKYIETKDKRYWKELVRWLPESWLQTRTVTLNYENLLAMCSKGQRRLHKLNEWSGLDDHTKPNFISWARSLPYAQELIFIDELEA